MESRKGDVGTAMHYSWFCEEIVSEISTILHRTRYGVLRAMYTTRYNMQHTAQLTAGTFTVSDSESASIYGHRPGSNIYVPHILH